MTEALYVPRLRILIDGVYVQSGNLSGSSTYHKYVSLVRELTARGHFVYWMLPDTDYTPNEIESHPNVGIIRTEHITDQFVVDGLITDKFFNLFNRIAGTYHIDVLVTCRTSLALTYKRTLESPRFFDVEDVFSDKSYGLPVVVIEEFPQTRKRQFTTRAYWWAQCLGYLAADSSIFLSEHNRTEVADAMTDTLAVSVIRKWTERTKVIPAGVECAQLDKLYTPDRWKVEKGFQVLCLGRLFGPSYIEYVPWFDYLFKAGMSDVCLTISLSGRLQGPMKNKLKRAGFDFANVGKQFVILENNPRDNFIRMLRKFACFVCPLSHLDHPTGIFEALYMGVPGILTESDYQRTFFPDYPFVIPRKKKEKLIGTLMWIRDNKEEARRLVLPWRDIIKEKYNAPVCIGQLADEIEKPAQKYLNGYRTPKGVQEMVNSLKGAKYKLDDVCAYVNSLAKNTNGVVVGDMTRRTGFTYARAAINHSMKEAGYVDDCTSPEEIFIRKDKFIASLKG